MALNEYDVGDVIKLSCTFLNAAGAPADPATITLRVRGPQETTPTSYTFAAGQISRTGVGAYEKTVTLATPGVWQYEWASTGDPTTVEGGACYARASRVA